MPSTSKHGTTRGLPIKEVLEYLLPELDLSCLRLALNTPKVTEQLMKLDEQGVGGQRMINKQVQPSTAASLNPPKKRGIVSCKYLC